MPGQWGDGIRFFEKDETLPTMLIERYQRHSWPLCDKITRSERDVEGYLL